MASMRVIIGEQYNIDIANSLEINIDLELTMKILEVTFAHYIELAEKAVGGGYSIAMTAGIRAGILERLEHAKRLRKTILKLGTSADVYRFDILIERVNEARAMLSIAEGADR